MLLAKSSYGMVHVMILVDAFSFLLMSADIIMWLVRLMWISHMEAGIFEKR